VFERRVVEFSPRKEINYIRKIKINRIKKKNEKENRINK